MVKFYETDFEECKWNNYLELDAQGVIVGEPLTSQKNLKRIYPCFEKTRNEFAKVTAEIVTFVSVPVLPSGGNWNRPLLAVVSSDESQVCRWCISSHPIHSGLGLLPGSHRARPHTLSHRLCCVSTSEGPTARTCFLCLS